MTIARDITRTDAKTISGRTRLLAVLLRLAGVTMMTAFFAILLPVDWMASTHEWLGMGPFPRSPVVDYLARSVAALYGFHGLLLVLVSRDPGYYRAIIDYIAFVNVAFGAIVLGIDVHAGMPTLWTWFEGPPIALFGIIVARLNRAPLGSS